MHAREETYPVSQAKIITMNKILVLAFILLDGKGVRPLVATTVTYIYLQTVCFDS